MRTTKRQHMYRCHDVLLLRAALHTDVPLPAWPPLIGDEAADTDSWARWLRDVWASDEVAAAVEHANPRLAREVEAVARAANPGSRQVRRTAPSLARYVLRMRDRATPFGLFAGVAPASFGADPVVRWGPAHRAVARADGAWVAGVVDRLESCPQLLARLPLVANDLAFVRGGRLVVPYPRPRAGQRAPREASLRHTPAVRLALEIARSPIRGDTLMEKLHASFPAAEPATVAATVTELVGHHVLISSLHAPSTVADAFGHVMEQLEGAAASGVPEIEAYVRRLRDVHEGVERHNLAAGVVTGRGMRTRLGATMAALGPAKRPPVAVDVRADCTLVLPPAVRREAATAASVLARLSPAPFGTSAWTTYHERFFERYGIGSLVPLGDVVDPDAGLGFPAGYLDAEAEQASPVSERDLQLLDLAQGAALDGRDEVTLDSGLVAGLSRDDTGRSLPPPHLELRFQVHARTLDDLARGDFTLWAPSPSRGVGTTTGRTLPLLDPPDRARAARLIRDLPPGEAGALPVQLSFPPLDPRDAHVARAPGLLGTVISLGEHREDHQDRDVIRLDDLAVGCDRRRLYLASLSRRRRLEPTVLHALDLRAHTPPLARFLAEVARSSTAVVTAFDWGAASRLAFLPRVRHGRSVLAPARWRLARTDLPGRAASPVDWWEALTAWRVRRRAPAAVVLTEGDRLLRLELDEPAHAGVLRAHLAAVGHAVVAEAPGPEAFGWFGGRAHEVVAPMTATVPPRAPAAPPVAAARPVHRGDGHVPGASMWLHAKLYGHVDRQAEIVSRWLPGLLAEWAAPPAWWFTRYRDPEAHVRLRIALDAPDQFGVAAGRLGGWALRLRRAGLLRDAQLATSFPEEGRWGNGPAMVAAEAAFAADSRALAVQFARPPARSQALAAANFVDIACGFEGSTDAGMAWLAEHARTTTAPPLPRDLRAQAVRLADPTGGHAALLAEPGGDALVQAWDARRRALAEYRALLDRGDHGGAVDRHLVLESLLHTHHIRAAGIDKADEVTCVRLARAAALAWRARAGGRRP